MANSLTEGAVAPSPGLSLPILACLAATWLIWGSTYLAIKWALISLPPFFQMGTRFLVAGGLLMAWMRLVRKASWPTRAQWRNALWVGTLMLGGGMGGTAYAEQSVESGLVVAFIPVVPIMIAAINMAWKVYPSRLEATGIVVGLVGVLMLTQGAGFRASPQGLVAIAVACLSWSAGSVLSQRRWTPAPGATGFASEMLCGGCALMLMSLASGEPAAVASHWPFHAKAVLAWAYLVVFGSLLAFNAYMVLLACVSGGLAPGGGSPERLAVGGVSLRRRCRRLRPGRFFHQDRGSGRADAHRPGLRDEPDGAHDDPGPGARVRRARRGNHRAVSGAVLGPSHQGAAGRSHSAGPGFVELLSLDRPVRRAQAARRSADLQDLDAVAIHRWRPRAGAPPRERRRPMRQKPVQREPRASQEALGRSAEIQGEGPLNRVP